MRTLSTQESKVLAGGHVATGVRVSVANSLGSFIDLSSLYGRDWVMEVSIDAQVDQPVATADVKLARDSYQDSIAPLMQTSRINIISGSYSALVIPGATFKVETQTLPEGVSSSAGTWREVFRGFVDRVDAGSNPLTFHGRDLGAQLQDLWIEADKVYGSGGGVAVETVMQSIIKDAHGAAWTASTTKALRDRVTPTTQNGYWYRATSITGDDHTNTVEPTWPTTIGNTVVDNHVTWTCYGPCPTLYTPTTPSFLVTTYRQQQQSVLDAIRVLAQLPGWDVRYEWRASSTQFELTFFQPRRSNTTPDYTWNADTERSIQTLAIDRDNIRNKVSVIYSDPADLDATGAPKRKTVTSQDSTSQDQYSNGLPKFMQVAEAATSQIKTGTEATAMADAILSDLKDPVAEKAVDVPFFYAVQLGDLERFTANGVHYSADADLAVVGYRHSLSQTAAVTTLTCRGVAAGGHLEWLRMEARPGSAGAALLAGPGAPTGLSLTALVTGLVATFVAPVGSPVAADYELHISLTGSFTPSSTTFVVTGPGPRFEVHGLLAGSTYYVQIVPRDLKGNRGTASSEVSTTTLFADLVELALNGSFEVWSGGSGVVPDQWTMVTGTWATNIQRTTTHYDGTYGITFPSSTSAYEIKGTPVPAKPSRSYLLSAFAKRGTGSPSNGSVLVEVYVDWMSDPTTVLSTDTFQLVEDPGPPATTVFQDIGNSTTSNASTAYARVRVKKLTNAVAFSAFVDAISLQAV